MQGYMYRTEHVCAVVAFAMPAVVIVSQLRDCVSCLSHTAHCTRKTYATIMSCRVQWSRSVSQFDLRWVVSHENFKL